MRCLLIGTVIGTVLLFAACTARFAGTLTLNGAAFVPHACRSGQALGFSGIEISDAGGRRLRLLMNVDGTANVGMFTAGAARGENFGTCAVLTVRAQSSRINGITNMAGTATLSCQASAQQLGGRVDFENCH